MSSLHNLMNGIPPTAWWIVISLKFCWDQDNTSLNKYYCFFEVIIFKTEIVFREQILKAGWDSGSTRISRTLWNYKTHPDTCLWWNAMRDIDVMLNIRTHVVITFFLQHNTINQHTNTSVHNMCAYTRVFLPNNFETNPK